jgi:hypothetical protein
MECGFSLIRAAKALKGHEIWKRRGKTWNDQAKFEKLHAEPNINMRSSTPSPI